MKEQHTSEGFGYKGSEMLMNPVTGSVCTAREWADSAADWDESDSSVSDQFAELIEVTPTLTEEDKQEWGDWKEVV